MELILPLLLAAIAVRSSTAEEAFAQQENAHDANGYVLYCPCMGEQTNRDRTD